MRAICVWTAGAALIASAPAWAADQLKFGAPPAWVIPQVIPAASAKAKDRPVAMLLHDQQTMLEPGKISTFSELAFKIQKPEGLAAGNLSIAWNPAFDTATVNRLEIHRGNQVIDVLKSGQTFTTMRRESNLELAMLDGVLTANIQPEGLQEGDIVVLAYTDEHSDPVLKGHVEATFAPWGSAQIGLAHARLAWPSTLDVRIQKMGDLPATQPTTRDRTKVYELTMRDVEPVIAPKGAPLRFHIARIGEATDFRSWAEPAKLLMPLFRDAAVISASGSLHDEVDKIRKASADPKNRTEQALQLVQERVRYVALLMGQGGYVPAPADTTWSRRYGDCKAKTALLLAILHDLGITAEAVVANVVAGDVIADRLPSIGMFNHVLVRAHIGGKTYWLDGTRTGDTSLDDIKVPDFGWGLPLVDNAQLIHIVPAPLREPSAEHNVSIDASAGIFAPSTITIEEVDRSDSAVQLSTVYSASSAEQRDEQFRNTARGYFDDFTVGSSSYQFDKAKREFVVTIKGTAKLDWKDSWFNVPTSSIAFDPDFDRLAGPFHDAPWAISHPRYVKDHVTVRLPAGFAAEQKLEPNVHETLAGVEYARSETVNGDVITVDSSERSIVAEVPYKDTLAAAPRLKALSKDGVYLQVASVYHSTPGDLTVLAASRPVSAYDYVQRGSAYQSAKKYDEAITDFTASLSLDSKNVPVLLMRAYAHLDNGDFVEAEKDVSSAEVIAPADAGVAQARIIIATRRADWPNVVAATTKALALDPKNKLALQKRSWAYVQKKDYAAAEKDLAALESIDPTNDAVTATRAAIADRKGDLQSALAGYSKALERNPGDTFARYQRGMLLYRDWKYDDAIRDYSEILRNDPKNAEVLGSRALAYVYKGDYAAAEADTAFGLKLSPKNSGLLFAKAKLDERRGSSDAEIESYSKLIESSPDKGYAYLQRAGAYLALNRYDLALADTEQALKLGYKAPDLRIVRANIFLLRDQRDAAASEAEAMIKDNPDSYAFVAAAKTYAALGQRPKAMQLFDRALALEPNAIVYANRAGVRPYNDLDGRLADLDAALKLEPNNVDVIAAKASQLVLKGDYPGALQLYDLGSKIEPDNAAFALGRAEALYKTGRRAEAEAILSGSREKAKTGPQYLGLCWAEARAGMFLETALRDCNKARELDSNTKSAIRALVLLRLGRIAEAEEAFSTAIKENHSAFNYMGRAFAGHRRGDRAKAEADRAEALRLDPDEELQFAEYGLEFDAPSASAAAAH